MKKKIFMLLLAAVISTSAIACGDKGQGDAQEENTKADDKKDGDEKTEGGQAGGAQADQISYKIEDCVKLGDYTALKIPIANSYEVTKEQIEDAAQQIAESKPVYKDTDKDTVEDGDIVNIDYEGKKDGVAFQGGTDQGHNLTIGSHDFIDGFEDGLIGSKVGDTVDLNLTFPENYGNSELAGAAVVFTVKINKIVEVDKDAKPELTDEFVQSNFNCQTVEEYRKQVKESLEMQNETSKQTDTRQAVVDKLQELCEVTMPEGLLDARVADYIVQFTNQNCSGTTLGDYLSSYYNGMTEDDFKSEINTEMEKNLKTELILEAIAQKEGMELEEDAFQEYVQQQMSAYGYSTADDFYKANGVTKESGEKYQRKVCLCNKALDMVIENAKIEYGVVSEEQAE